MSGVEVIAEVGGTVACPTAPAAWLGYVRRDALGLVEQPLCKRLRKY
jgi:hypothetical protein